MGNAGERQKLYALCYALVCRLPPPSVELAGAYPACAVLELRKGAGRDTAWMVRKDEFDE